MTSERTGRRRLLLGAAAVVACGCALTAASLTDSAEVVVTMDGSGNRFDIVVAGRYGADALAWQPITSDWAQGNPDAYELALGPDAAVLSPGGFIDGRVAVRNDSPRLSGDLTLSIYDPLPRGEEVDPVTGNRVELFDQLLFTVWDGPTLLFERVPAADLDLYAWSEPFGSGDEKVLDVRIEMSETADNRWQLASTDVQFSFEAVAR